MKRQTVYYFFINGIKKKEKTTATSFIAGIKLVIL